MNLWSLVADGLGAVSGLLMLRSAFRINSLLREAKEAETLAGSTRSGLDRKVGEANAKAASRQASQWDLTDQRCLYLGAVLLVLSFAVKFFAEVFAGC